MEHKFKAAALAATFANGYARSSKRIQPIVIREMTPAPPPPPPKTAKEIQTSPPPTPKPPRKEEEPYKRTRDMGECAQCCGICTLFILPIAVVASVVGVATHFWYVDGNGDDWGMFSWCDGYTKVCTDITSYTSTSMEFTYKAVTGLIIGGACVLFIGVLLLCCYPCNTVMNQYKISCGTAIAFVIFLGAAAVIAGCGLFVNYYIEQLTQGVTLSLNWSFYMACFGGVIAILTAFVFLIHVCMMSCSANE